MGIINRLKEKFGKKDYVEVRGRAPPRDPRGSVGEMIKRQRILRDARRNIRRQDWRNRISRTRQVVKKTYEATRRGIPIQKSSQISQKSSQISRTTTAQAVARQFGQRLPTKYQGKKGYASRGRPKGPSGRYIIPGKGAVGVYEFRKWARYQRRMASMRQQQQMSQQMVQQPRRYAQTSQGMVERTPQPQYPQNQQQEVQQTQEYPVQEQMPIQQEQEPVGSFNAFKVPNPFSQQSQAPVKNRNLFMENNLNLPTERPITNPQGDWFTETDWLTGKQVLRRRPSTNRVFQQW